MPRNGEQGQAMDVRESFPELPAAPAITVPPAGPGDAFAGAQSPCASSGDPPAARRAGHRWLDLMSHEMRTPLTSIIGYTELLLDGQVGDVTPDQREFLQIVRRNAERLATLVEEVLDLTVEG